MMFSLSMLFILQLAIISQGTPYCPKNKKVGDTCYTRVDTIVDFKKYNCYQDCTYKKAGTGGRMDDGLWCFMQGNSPVSDSECGDTEESLSTVPGDTEESLSTVPGDTEEPLSTVPGDTEESLSTVPGDTEESLPTISGQITIWNNYDVKIKGVVEFAISDDCGTEPGVEYEVQPGSYTFVQYSGECDVFQISGYEGNINNINNRRCIDYSITTSEKDFYIIKNKNQDCQIATPGGDVKITNQYDVAITGLVNFEYRNCIVNDLPYTVNVGSTETIYYFGTCEVSIVSGEQQTSGEDCTTLYLFNGDTQKAFNIVKAVNGHCKIQ